MVCVCVCVCVCVGGVVQLCYSYPRGVSEPAIYHDANVIGTEAEGDVPPPLPAPKQQQHLAPKPSVRVSGPPAHLGNSTDLSVGQRLHVIHFCVCVVCVCVSCNKLKALPTYYISFYCL